MRFPAKSKLNPDDVAYLQDLLDDLSLSTHGMCVTDWYALRCEPACAKCNDTGYLTQPYELNRWYSRQRCSCHPDYNAETERLRQYS